MESRLQPGTRPAGPRPLRLGVWTDFGHAQVADKSVQSFLNGLTEQTRRYFRDLLAGFVELNRPIEIVVSDPKVYQELATQLAGKPASLVRLVYPGGRFDALKPRALRAIGAWNRLVRGKRHLEAAAAAKWGVGKQQAGRALQQMAQAVYRSARRKNPAAILVAAVGVPAGFLAGWSLYGAFQAARAAAKTLGFPLAVLHRGVQRLREKIWELSAKRAHDLACDVWLLPYGDPDLKEQVVAPAVFFMPDLAARHFPRAVMTGANASIFPFLPEHWPACVSPTAFFEDPAARDLPEFSRFRMKAIPPAPESAQPAIPLAQSVPAARPYLFVPSAGRLSPFFRTLVEALNLLTLRHKEAVDVVFAGGPLDVEKGEVVALLDKYGLGDRVHFRECANPADRVGLAAGSFAVLVPPGYETAAFSLPEMVRGVSPVACADLPSLRKLCQSLGDAMPYYNPSSSESISKLVHELRDTRDRVAAAQLAAHQAPGTGRTRADVAGEWLTVLEQAVLQNTGPQTNGTLPEAA